MPYILEELEVYLLSEKLAEEIWQIVIAWPAFKKFGIGKQLTSSVDSISANIAEGYGRFFCERKYPFLLLCSWITP